MIQKRQLARIILTSNKTMAYEDHNFNRSPIINFQRDKTELINELLKTHSQIDYQSKRNKDNQHPFQQDCKNESSISIDILKMEEFQKRLSDSQFSQLQQDYIQQLKIIDKQACISKETTNDANISNIYQYPNIFFNQYMKSAKKYNQKQVITQQVKTKENFQVINEFFKDGESLNAFNLRSKKSIYQEAQYLPIKIENKSFNNESTMALSKFNRNDASPHRTVRRTQKKQSKSKVKSKQKHFNQNQRKTPQISHFDKANNQPVKHLFFDLSGKDNKNDSSKLEYSQSLQMSGIYSIPSPFKNTSGIQSNILSSLKRQQEQMCSSQMTSNLNKSTSCKNEGDEGIKKVYISLKQPKKLVQRQTTQIKQESQQSSDKLEKQNNSKCIDPIFQQKNEEMPKPTVEYMKKSFQDYKQILKLKDQQAFKKQVQSESIKFEKKFNNNYPKEQREKLFTGCQQLNYRRQFPLQESQQSLPQSTVKQVEEIKMLEKVEKEEGVFSYLANKTKNLKNKQSNNQAKLKIRQQRNRKTNENAEEWSMKPELSQQSSSSCSFLRQKQGVTENGINHVNEIVNQTVKTVAINLQKAAIKQRENCMKLSTPQKRPQNVYDQRQQSKQSNKVKKSLSLRQKIQQFQQKNIQSSEKKPIIYDKQNAFLKIFGLSEKDKTNIENQHLNNDFFSSKQNDVSNHLSHPSTVQKISELSEEKSDFMRHFQQLKDEQMNNLFNKNVLQPQQNHNILGQLCIESSKKDIEKNQRHITPPKNDESTKRIVINIENLKDISLSQDAISFSKFASGSENDQNQSISMQSFKIQTSSKKANVQDQQKLKQTNFAKKGVVRKIQINLQNSSDDQSSKEDDKQKQIDEQILNLDQIQNYDSDEDEKQSNLVKNQTKPKSILTPVIEEDLQQSQFRNLAITKKSTRSIINYKTNKANDSDLKQLQQQFLKDFHFEKVESQILQDQISKQSGKSDKKEIKNMLKSSVKNISIDKYLEVDKFQESYLLQENAQQMEEKDIMDSIKEGISSLKIKMESSIGIENSKSFSLSSHAKSKRQPKKISIQLKSNNSKQSSNKQYSYSSSSLKFNHQPSVSIDKKRSNCKENKSNISDINFDLLNEECEKQQAYQQFKQDFSKLKKKMEFDAKIGLGLP